MHIDIQARDFALTKALRLHIEKRLSFALSTRYDHIKRIIVRLSDINGPRGGNDKRCQLHVVLPGQQDVVIEDTQADLYTAIDRAADRAWHSVSRKLARLRAYKRIRRHADVMPKVLINRESY